MDAVLNWLWQGGVVALAATAMLRVIEPVRAQARYGALWVALLSVLVLPFVPLIWAAAWPARASGGIPAAGGPVVSIPVHWSTSSAVAIGLWVVWSSVYASRVARAGLALRRAKRHCRHVPPALEARLRYWTQVRTTGRRTRMVLSSNVCSAAVLGCGSPVIAVAPALLHHLSDDELDRVVIHEWAHVQRRDDLANVVQLLVRVVAGWHPAVWWLDRQLHMEREIACDEIAVAVTGSAKGYAACLTRLASLQAGPLRSFPAVAALSSSGLRHRIVRILSPGQPALARSRHAAAIVTGGLLCMLALTIGGFRFIEAGASATDVGTMARTAPAYATAMTRLLSLAGPHPRSHSLGGPLRGLPSGASLGPQALLVAPQTPAPSLSSSEVPGARREPSARTERQTTRGSASAGETAAAAPAMSTPRAPTDPPTPSHVEEQPLPTVTSIPSVTFAALESSPFDPSTLREPQGRPEHSRGTTNSGSSRAASRDDRLRATLSSAEGSPLLSVTASQGHASVSAALPATEVKPVSPWGAAADAGVAVGRGSQKAALATAGFFGRVGKRIAGSF